MTKPVVEKPTKNSPSQNDARRSDDDDNDNDKSLRRIVSGSLPHLLAASSSHVSMELLLSDDSRALLSFDDHSSSDEEEEKGYDDAGSKMAKAENEPLTRISSSSDTCADRAVVVAWRSIIISTLFVLVCGQRLAWTQMTNLTQPLQQASPSSVVDPYSVYVPGGGFSGFWFTLGRLQSTTQLTATPHIGGGISTNTNFTTSREKTRRNGLMKILGAAPRQKRHQYYCFSAGCLGVVSVLSKQQSMPELYAMARGIQLQWIRGEISRYDVVPIFVKQLLAEYQGNLDARPVWLDQLSIITSTRKLPPTDESASWWLTRLVSSLGLQPAIRTPSSIRELQTMLIQTTWIPLAIGNALSYQGHLDGAFTTPAQHVAAAAPAKCCAHSVGLTLDAGLLMNAVNVNLSWERVQQFYQAGLELGL